MKIRTPLLVLAAGALAAPAFAGSVTMVQPATSGNEPSIDAIANALLGQSTNLASMNTVGGGVSGGGLFAGRVSDDADQIFHDGIVEVTFTALYWGGNSLNNPEGNAAHSFGFSLENGPAQSIFSSTGTDVNDSVTISPAIGSGDIRWFADRSGNTAWSDPSMNSAIGATGSTDRMITVNLDGISSLSLLGAGGGSVALDAGAADRFSYLLFFDTGRDGDYNDLVVLVQGVTHMNVIPLPGAAGASLLGFGALAARRRRN